MSKIAITTGITVVGVVKTAVTAFTAATGAEKTIKFTRKDTHRNYG